MERKKNKSVTDFPSSMITKFFVSTSYGKIHIRSVGDKKDPLFLIIHGSGTGNSGEIYEPYLYEYYLRFKETWPLYLVAFDCPGYGQSTGLRSVIRGFPSKFISELILILTGRKEAFIMMGHSQGGNSMFNSVYDNLALTNFIIAERPVIAEPKKYKDFPIPILFIYDEEDDGHPIKKGLEMTKYVKNYKFIKYKTSKEPNFISDRFFDEILVFLYEKKEDIKSKQNLPNFEKISEFNGIKFPNSSNKIDVKIQDSNNEIKELNPKKLEIPIENVPKEQQIMIDNIFSLEKISIKDQDKENKNEKDNFIYFDQPENPDEKFNNTLSSIDSSSSSLNCPLCMDIYIKPINIDCGHTFCQNCIKLSLLYNPDCPLCRKSYNSDKIEDLISDKNLNRQIENKIIDVIGVEKYNEKLLQLKAQTSKINNNQIQIEYGNLAEPMTRDNRFNLNGKTKCKWTVYVKTVKSPVKNPISEVLFYINPHLSSCPPIKTTNPPFILERNGSYEFSMDIKIIFLKKLNLEPYVTSYALNLKEYKSKKNIFIDLCSSKSK